MNKVITINLNGVAYQLEEGGYDALRAYLEHAARRLEGNPDRDEIITDIEQAIADKFRALLGAHKTVVNTKEVAAVLTEMGPVEDASSAGTSGAAATAGAATSGQGGARPETGAASAASTGDIRRLYRIYPEGAMVSGVCSGLGAYFGLDPTLFRIGFVLLGLLWGAGLLAYGLMVILIPPATTPAEKAAASGAAATTAQEFIKRAREGYYEGMKSFHDKHARRAWKRKFKQEMRGWKYGARQSAQAAYWKNWSYNWTNSWQQGWDQRPVPTFGLFFLAPLLSLLQFALLLGAVYAVYSLVKWQALFGVAVPVNLPLWAAILLVVVAYQFIAWPLKAVRYSYYFPGRPCSPGGGLFGSLVGLFFLGFGIWMLDRHVPEFHAWLVQLPDLLHRFIDTVSGWFAPKSSV